jgi:small subunit ribosomal protein S2
MTTLLNKDYVKKYLKACLQYGHPLRKWNPKMAPYILSEKNGFYIFNINLSLKLLDIAGNFLEEKAKKGGSFLFVGTNVSSYIPVKTEALLSKNYYINYRWLGGLLTNWATVKVQIEFLKNLQKQKIQGEFKKLTKKEATLKEKKIEKLQKLFEGIIDMKKLPDVVIFTNQSKDLLAIQECIALGIPSVCIVDTIDNPDLIPYPIPGNANSKNSIQFILTYLNQKILNGFKYNLLKI